MRRDERRSPDPRAVPGRRSRRHDQPEEPARERPSPEVPTGTRRPRVEARSSRGMMRRDGGSHTAQTRVACARPVNERCGVSRGRATSISRHRTSSVMTTGSRTLTRGRTSKAGSADLATLHRPRFVPRPHEIPPRRRATTIDFHRMCPVLPPRIVLRSSCQEEPRRKTGRSGAARWHAIGPRSLGGCVWPGDSPGAVRAVVDVWGRYVRIATNEIGRPASPPRVRP